MCCINFHLSVILTFNVVLTCSAVLTSTLCRGDMDFTKSKFLCHNWELVISKMVLFLVATPTSTLSVHDLALYSMSDLPWQTWGTRETWRTRDTRGTGYTKMAKRTRATAKRDKTDLASSYLWRAAFTILAMFSLILVKDKILPRQFWRKPLRGWFEGWTRRRESLASWWWPLRWWSTAWSWHCCFVSLFTLRTFLIVSPSREIGFDSQVTLQVFTTEHWQLSPGPLPQHKRAFPWDSKLSFTGDS